MWEILGVVLATIGMLGGGISGVVQHKQNLEDTERARDDLTTQIDQAREMYELQRTQAETGQAQAIEHLQEQMAGERALATTGQISTERQAGQSIFDTVVAGGRALGTTEAALSTSGVRKTGSVERTLEGVEEEYENVVSRQEQNLSDTQNIFDVQLKQSYEAEERQIEQWDKQLTDTLDMLNLQESQFVAGLASDRSYLDTQVAQMRNPMAYVGAFFGGANVSAFANSLANLDNRQTTTTPTPTYQKTEYSYFDDPNYDYRLWSG